LRELGGRATGFQGVPVSGEEVFIDLVVVTFVDVKAAEGVRIKGGEVRRRGSCWVERQGHTYDVMIGQAGRLNFSVVDQSV